MMTKKLHRTVPRNDKNAQIESLPNNKRSIAEYLLKIRGNAEVDRTFSMIFLFSPLADEILQVSSFLGEVSHLAACFVDTVCCCI